MSLYTLQVGDTVALKRFYNLGIFVQHSSISMCYYCLTQVDLEQDSGRQMLSC